MASDRSLPATGRKETWKDVGIRYPTGVVEKRVDKGVEPKSQAAIVYTGDFVYTQEERIRISALGEVLEARLHETLREDLGGTYGVSAGVNYTRIPVPEYTVSIDFGSAPERNDELVKAVFAQVEGRSSPEFAKLFATYQRIKTSYVEPVEDEVLIRGAIDGMLAALEMVHVSPVAPYFIIPIEIDGESRDTVIAVRELNLAGLGQGQRTWVNDHTVFTHGFGVVAAYTHPTTCVIFGASLMGVFGLRGHALRGAEVRRAHGDSVQVTLRLRREADGGATLSEEHVAEYCST